MSKKSNNNWLWLLGGGLVLLLLSQNKDVAGSLYAGTGSGGGSGAESYPQIKLDMPVPEAPNPFASLPYSEGGGAVIPTELPVVPYSGGAWGPGEGAPAGMTLPTYEAQAAAIRAANPGMTAVESFTAVRVAQNTTSLGAKLQASAGLRAQGLTGVALTSAMREAGII